MQTNDFSISFSSKFDANVTISSKSLSKLPHDYRCHWQLWHSYFTQHYPIDQLSPPYEIVCCSPTSFLSLALAIGLPSKEDCFWLHSNISSLFAHIKNCCCCYGCFCLIQENSLSHELCCHYWLYALVSRAAAVHICLCDDCSAGGESFLPISSRTDTHQEYL